MRPRRLHRLVWFAVAGPPIAWAVQFVLGYGVTEAACPPGSSGVSVNAWAVAATAVAALVAVLGGAAAVAVFRATRGLELDDPPPAGRIYYMSIIALATTPLFLAIIVMNGVGVLVLEQCHQS